MRHASPCRPWTAPASRLMGRPSTAGHQPSVTLTRLAASVAMAAAASGLVLAGAGPAADRGVTVHRGPGRVGDRVRR
jgi:hypothetical protein